MARYGRRAIWAAHHLAGPCAAHDAAAGGPAAAAPSPPPPSACASIPARSSSAGLALPVLSYMGESVAQSSSASPTWTCPSFADWACAAAADASDVCSPGRSRPMPVLSMYTNAARAAKGTGRHNRPYLRRGKGEAR